MEYLDDVLGAGRRTSEASVNAIALLREYRTRLIADVVTGKLDVRSAAADLPDETAEPPASDDTDVATGLEGGEGVFDGAVAEDK